MAASFGPVGNWDSGFYRYPPRLQILTFQIATDGLGRFLSLEYCLGCGLGTEHCIAARKNPWLGCLQGLRIDLKGAPPSGGKLLPVGGDMFHILTDGRNDRLVAES